MKSLLFPVVCSFVVFAVANADEKKDPRVSARAKYAKQAGDVLNIVEPVKLSRGFGWKDGGTVGIELLDTKGKKHSFSLYSPGGAGLPVENKPPKIIPNLFIGAAHPKDQGAKMVAVRGPEESALYGVLLRAIDQHPEKEALLAKEIDEKLWTDRKLWGTGLLDFHTFFHRLESHFLKADGERGVNLPDGDPLLQAIQKRLGRPDRVTGSGRMFIHYDLENGDTLTLIVSGREIIGAGIEHAKKK